VSPAGPCYGFGDLRRRVEVCTDMYVSVNLGWAALLAGVILAMWCVHRYPRSVVPIATGVAVAGVLYTIMEL
jgi:hypothetical protein